ncbi:hypothetical protein KKC62_03350 [Patescibacteria group bacterium]|nr:hypothetical protein [Patescibacteria group bacterium]MBU1953215.1 hypothetical protein [Patescibacteria group bacterium]
MINPSEIHTALNENIDKLKDTTEGIFILGDVQTKSLTQILKESVEDKQLHRREILSFGLSLIYNGLPNSTKKILQEQALEKTPLDIPKINEYRVMERLGSGGMNIVYFFSPHEGKSFSVGLKRRGFDTEKEAGKFAKAQKTEYEYFRDMYKDVPNLIPEENQVLYRNYKNEISLMFVRKYVPEPLRDFFKIPREELENIIISNREFRDQLLKFATISLENSDTILNEELDILGDKNLAVTGEKGKEKLILLDPHTILAKKPEIRSRIENRLNQLKEMLIESSLNITVPIRLDQLERV